MTATRSYQSAASRTSSKPRCTAPTPYAKARALQDYLRNNFNGFRDAFTLDERSLLAFAAAYNIAGPLYFRADFTRQWQLLPNRPKIEAVDHYSVGLALFVSL